MAPHVDQMPTEGRRATLKLALDLTAAACSLFEIH
jgi:hypothetical protein